MTDHTWPTAPVIRARWRAYGSNSYDAPALYFRATSSGDYLNPGTGKWRSPEHGEFVTVTEYVEATQLEKRLDQIRQLEKALREKKCKLRRKNATIKNLSLASGTLAAPRARIHKDRITGTWWGEVTCGHRRATYMCASHADAIAQATKKLAALTEELHQ